MCQLWSCLYGAHGTLVESVVFKECQLSLMWGCAYLGEFAAQVVGLELMKVSGQVSRLGEVGSQAYDSVSQVNGGQTLCPPALSQLGCLFT